MEEGRPYNRQEAVCLPYIGIDMKNIGIIELEGMEFKAYHGCLEQEKVRGNSFTVDFRGEMDLSAAAESDNLNDTVNYGEIYELVDTFRASGECCRPYRQGDREKVPAVCFVFRKGFQEEAAGGWGGSMVKSNIVS